MTLPLDSYNLKGYLFYDPKKELEEKESFTGRLLDIWDELAKVRLKKGKPAYFRFNEIAGKFKNSFDWKKVDNRIEATIRQNAVAQRMN
ncbi:MAG: hypothetical protein Q7J09_06105 [Methanocalculus sp.]|uniref:hypothetical protein n=1 Tax=Methanocalculus sp. TaxID=2004547 RepID=UPI002722AFFB|nr:hypothetical protein [Methanocalculus sp.]MDO9539559.1 hypothetical protein [Methanocalculus sp.]